VQDKDIYVDGNKKYDADADQDENDNVDSVFGDATSLQDMPETKEEKNYFPLRSFANCIPSFRKKETSAGTIDVWWLYDDGGLSMLIPFILKTRVKFSNVTLRVFTLSRKKKGKDVEEKEFKDMLTKFRIDFSAVTVIDVFAEKPKEKTRDEFKHILEEISQQKPTEEELIHNKEKNDRHLRLAELLREISVKSERIIMTLPFPKLKKQGEFSNTLYMCWLEIMTRDMPPFLLVRGNQTSVLTYYC
jgi:solute carrier family 12 sodium/potassium/chloride transporter 2